MKNYDVIIVDGSSYLFRAYHALPNLRNQKGEPTGAIYGVINMLMKLRHAYDSQYFIVVFDAPGKNFRHELFVDYKANRGSMPDDLREQIKPLHALIKHLGLPILMQSGVEADDVIASLAKIAKERDKRVLVSTGDKDLAQIVCENVHLINTMTGFKMDEEGVVTKFGVRADQILDYLTLIGDNSDNIPGVDKVGPKTAVKWLTKYDNLDQIVEHRHEIKGVVGQNLADQHEQFPWVKALISLKDDLEITESWEEFIPKSQNNHDLLTLFRDLDFKKWAEEIDSQKREVVIKPVVNWSADCVGFDKDAILLQTPTHQLIFAEQIIVAGLEADVLSGNAFTYVNAKSVFHGLNTTYPDDFDCLTLLQYCVKSSVKCDDLARWVNESLGRDLSDEARLVITEGHTSQLALSELHEVLFALKQELLGQLDQQQEIYALEKELMAVIVRMEKKGVAVDVDQLMTLDRTWEKEQAQRQEKVLQLAGRQINIDSPKQLRELLFDQLGLPVLEKTSTGAPSTSEPVLAQLAKEHDIAREILDYRMYAKLRSTYTQSLVKAANNPSGRVHAEFLQNGTVTGRLSSRGPNLQNIPIKTAEGRKIRGCFVVAPGRRLLAVDYSQIELRLVAHLAQDPVMIAALASGEDIHQAVASEVFSVEKEQVTADLRRKAKAINFGLIYGISAFGLSKQLDISPKEAKEIIEQYFARFSKIKAFMTSCIDQAREKGYVQTPAGRRIMIDGISEKNAIRRQAAERVAINAPVQGMAADIMKKAMVTLASEILQKQQDIDLVMQVHDELVFEVDAPQVAHYTQLVVALMEKVIALSVPLIAVAGVGENWDEAH